LIRETENELIAQAVIISNIYKKMLQDQFPTLDLSNYGKALPQKHWHKEDANLGKWRPLPATLNLNSAPIAGFAPNAIELAVKADKKAWQLGMQLDDLLKETQLTTLAGIRILDVNGIIVSSTGWTKNKSLISMKDVKEALTGTTTRIIRKREPLVEEPKSFLSSISRTSDIRIHLTYPIVLNKRIIGAVHLMRTPANVYQNIYQNKELFLSYTILLIALILAISFFMAYAITRPIKALVKQAKKATDGAYNQLTVLKHPVTAEFELLSQTLVKMSDKQAARAEQIKNFASYVSHEFKTPITAITGAVEVLQDHLTNMSAQEQQQFLNNIAFNAKRMNLLMRQLTELAKADTNKIPTMPTDLGEILAKQVTHYQQKFSQITLTKTALSYPVFMNNELLTSIIINLFENVQQHGGENINIDLSLTESSTVLDFIDDGPGISEHNAKRIFEPFFTTAKETGGTGLGLAILSTLITAHKGNIHLLNSDKGCQFRLIFPRFT
jgi:signal transduction histidine kinase